MTGRILVPLDGSSLAERALSCALTLAQALPAELALLRAIWIPPDVSEILDNSAVNSNAVVDKLEAEANDYLSTLAEKLREASLNVHHAVRRGPAAETIPYRGHLTPQKRMPRPTFPLSRAACRNKGST
jgi:nucleotide-binding universal stress UspA family protein